MDRVDRSPDEFIASIDDDDLRDGTAQLDALIRKALKSRCRVLWEGVFWGGTDQSIIGYGDIVQPRPRGDDVEWFLVGLARQKAHWSVYVNAAEDGRYPRSALRRSAWHCAWQAEGRFGEYCHPVPRSPRSTWWRSRNFSNGPMR